MTLYGFTDGASRGNPGESGIGILLKDEKGETVFASGGYIGLATNNLAEYTALFELLRRVSGMECERLIVSSDSELMVRQMKGEYKVKNKEIARLHRRIREILERNSFTFEIRHISRDENSEADRLANQGIETRKRLYS